MISAAVVLLMSQWFITCQCSAQAVHHCRIYVFLYASHNGDISLPFATRIGPMEGLHPSDFVLCGKICFLLKQTRPSLVPIMLTTLSCLSEQLIAAE